jgi:hypothetical protein
MRRLRASTLPQQAFRAVDAALVRAISDVRVDHCRGRRNLADVVSSNGHHLPCFSLKTRKACSIGTLTVTLLRTAYEDGPPAIEIVISVVSSRSWRGMLGRRFKIVQT